MKFFEPTTQPAVNVAAATIITIPISEAYRDFRIERIVIIPVSGDATSSAPVVSTDSAASAREKQIASFSGVTAAAPVDHDNGGQGYAWDRQQSADGAIYVKPTPNAGVNNSYKILIGIGGRR